MAAILLASLVVWVADESVKVRPADSVPASGPARIALAAAGGECVGAQGVVRGPARGLAGSAAPLRAADGRAVPVRLARVATIALQRPSGIEGSVGEWPDPLIPVRDAVYGEERNAFPVNVAAGRNQAIFVEVCPTRRTGA